MPGRRCRRHGAQPGRHLAALPAVLLTVALGIPNTAAAADPQGHFAMKGAGFLPCQMIATAREKRSDVYFLIAGWVEGFLSAYNRDAPETFDVTTFESTELILSVIDGHCKEHPGDRLYPILNSIVLKLAPDRLRAESARVEVSDGTRKALLYQETIRRMQAALRDRGLYKGAINGHYASDSEAAIIAFQRDVGLEATGFPDQVTLWRLLRK